MQKCHILYSCKDYPDIFHIWLGICQQQTSMQNSAGQIQWQIPSYKTFVPKNDNRCFYNQKVHLTGHN